MDKIIVRKNILFPGSVSHDLLELTNGKTYSTKNLTKKFGYKAIMKNIFHEDSVESDNLTETALYKAYEDLLKSEKMENEYFIKVYYINSMYSLELSRNIYLYHLVLDKQYKDIVPWFYADAKKYLGDIWGETDDEILENIKKMNVVDFLDWYKGYY